MTPTLDDFETAYDDAQPSVSAELAWARIEKAIRRRKRQPAWDLFWVLSFFVTCIVVGFNGNPSAFFVGLGLSMTAIPQRWKARKKWLEDISVVDSMKDMRALCAKQADDQFGHVVISMLMLSVISVLFLLTALIAFFVGKSPWPGSMAALALMAWVTIQFFFRLPRFARESSILDEDDDDAEDEDGDDD